MSSILYDNTLCKEIFKTKDETGFVFQKDIYIINLIKRKQKKRLLSLSIKGNNNLKYYYNNKNKQMVSLPYISLSSTKNSNENYANYDRGPHLTNKYHNPKQLVFQMFQYTNETKKEKKTVFKIQQHTMSANNIHNQFLNLNTRPPMSPNNHRSLLKNKEILALLEKEMKKEINHDNNNNKEK